MLFVSVEGLPGTCRDALAKALQHRLGAAAVPEFHQASGADGGDGLTVSLSFLLHQMRSLRHVADASLVVGTSSWLDKAPGQAWRPLHRRLAQAVGARLGLAGGEHRMVYLRTDPHAAFEGVVNAGGEARDVGLRDTILPLQARLEACATGAEPPDGLFPRASVIVVACPRFGDDAMGSLAALAAQAAASLAA